MQMIFASLNQLLLKYIDSEFLVAILIIVLIFAGMYFAQKVVDQLIIRYFRKAYKKQVKSHRATIGQKRFDTLSKAFRSISSVVIWVVGIMLIVNQTPLHQHLAALFASASIVGIAIGIAGKDIIMDFYVGMMALLEDQYRVGDTVVLDPDHSGTVDDITLRIVKLRDVDGNLHIVPHSMARAIINKTYGYSNVNIELGVAYDADIEKVKKVVNDTGKAMLDDPVWKADFIDPIIYQTMLRFDESQLTFRAQGKVKPGRQWAVASEFRMRIKQAFDKNNIEIPFPQRVIRQINEDATKSTKK